MFIAAYIAVALVFAAEPLLHGEIQPVEEGYAFSEGPLWLPEEDKWIFSDVQADTIYDSHGERHLKPSKNTNGLILDPKQRVVACQSQTHSVVRFERDGTTRVLASHYKGKPLNSTNDLVVRSDGVIFFTDPIPLRKGFESALGFSGVFALWPDEGRIELLNKKMKYPNGIGLSPDEKTLYVSDTSDTGIWSYPLRQDGSISKGRKLCRIGIPDGLAVDDSGRIWTSSATGISVFSSEGQLIESFKTSMMPTNCAFGGPTGSTLLITARKRVYRVETAARGTYAYSRSTN